MQSSAVSLADLIARGRLAMKDSNDGSAQPIAAIVKAAPGGPVLGRPAPEARNCQPTAPADPMAQKLISGAETLAARLRLLSSSGTTDPLALRRQLLRDIELFLIEVSG